MATYYKNKYRNESIRLQNWDYRWDSSYFITICAKKNYFGEIQNNKMHLSPIGVLADVFWFEIKNHAKNVLLESFVVMPNHIHGIITLNGGWMDDNYMDDGNVGIGNFIGNGDSVGNVDSVGIGHALSLQNHIVNQPIFKQNHTQNHSLPKNNEYKQNINNIPWDTNNRKTIGQKRFQNIGKNSISSIVGSYKSAVTKHARRLGFEFEWQKLFYENKIRNEESHDNITNYIKNNIVNWDKDRFYFK